MPQNQIIINVKGGAVQDVFCTEPGADVFIVDWNSKGSQPGQPGIVQLNGGCNNRLVKIVAFPAEDASTLAGGVIERAVEAAFEQGVLPEGVC